MPNNPVQIILNDQDFHQAPDPGTPPRNKDFFDGRDTAFATHKAALLKSIDAIAAEVKASPYGPAAYLKVQMRSEAFAKSYRPVGWVFKPDQFPCVGADAVGTLYFRAPLIYMRALRQRIDEAELTVAIKHRKADGSPYKAPSPARAEVGAIDTIEITPPEDKRTFSTAAAMSMLADPRTVSGYHIELFETPGASEIADDPSGRDALRRSLEQVVLSFGDGTRAYFSALIGRTPVLEMQLTSGGERALIDNRVGIAGGDGATALTPVEIDRTPARHDAALNALQRHPLVRAIRPPVQLQLTDDQGAAAHAAADGAPLTMPKPAQGARYPIVGVIDSGVGDVLADWIVDRFDYLSDDEYDNGHGTGVAGLITVSQLVNPPTLTPEPNGCMIYDAPLYPKGAFLAKYQKGFSDFLEELEQAVTEAKTKHGVRIFNLSINAVSDVERYRYSIYAARLDQIADAHGVIFVNSVGNLPKAQARGPWPKRPGDVVKYFAARTLSDTIYKPSESVRSIAVGALNPPGVGQVDLAPTIYTTRGPGLQVGVKPDVCAVGGAGITTLGGATGLVSIAPSGAPQDVCGTSFAAPLVARALAGLDAATDGGLSLEALRAMLLHHTAMPEPLTKRGLKDIARQFAGFGQIGAVADMLETGDHQITLLFQSRLSIGERKPVILRFPFAWPQSMVDANGACSGRARISLVYAPPLDPAFGAEFVRVNLEASLNQRQTELAKDGRVRFINQIDAKFLPKAAKLAVPEKALIDHGLKWWPSKQYESIFNANGESSEWTIEVTSLVRAESKFPAAGVPFAVLLTLEDPEGKKPIFQQFRQALQASGARAQDVRTITRVRAR
jgi:Subtilase family